MQGDTHPESRMWFYLISAHGGLKAQQISKEVKSFKPDQSLHNSEDAKGAPAWTMSPAEGDHFFGQVLKTQRSPPQGLAQQHWGISAC